MNPQSTIRNPQSERPTIVMAGGGTGGHIYPAIAVAEAIRDAGVECDIKFLGTKSGLESRVVGEYGWSFTSVSARGVRGKSPWERIRGVVQVLWGTFQAFRHFRQWKPAVVLATSGYVSVPAVLAAAALEIPVVLHEQNVAAGWSTKCCARFSSQVLAAFDGLESQIGRSRVRVVGNPIRQQALEGERASARASMNIPVSAHVVLVTGGSQGSQTLNQAFEAQWPAMVEGVHDLRFLWAVGTRHSSLVTRHSSMEGFPGLMVPYHESMGEWYAAADVAVTRAGALTLSELAAWGLPAVLVPLERSGGGHQLANARWFSDRGAAEEVRERELDRLAPTVVGLFKDPKEYAIRCQKMQALGKRSAASMVAQILLGYLPRRVRC